MRDIYLIDLLSWIHCSGNDQMPDLLLLLLQLSTGGTKKP